MTAHAGWWHGGRLLTMEDAVSNITYKPGWTFRVEMDTDRPRLIIRAAVLHSETLDPVTFGIKRLIPRCARNSLKDFVDWVQDMVEEAEIYEAREFFRFGGLLTDNPHATEEVPV